MVSHGVPRLCDSYLCRVPSCGFFGLNSQWIKAVNDTWRCPACGEEFRPWADMNRSKTVSFFPAQKVISFITSTGELVTFPAVWAGTHETRWLRQQMENRAQQVNMLTEENIVAFLERNVKAIDEIARLHGVPGQFSLLRMSAETVGRIDTGKYPLENWAHLRDNGFFGAFMNLQADPPPQVFQDWDILISYFGNALAAGRRLRGR